MFFGFKRPPDITWTVSATGTGGTGQSIVSSIANVNDGRPDTTARYQWPTGGSQTTSTAMLIRGDWTATSFSPRLVGLSNISLPVGTQVTVSFRRTSDTLGTYPYSPTAYNNPQRIVAGPRGERTCWILLPSGASNILGVQFSIANNVNGSASITAGTYFNVGEQVVCGGVDWDLEPGWDQYEVDPTTRNFSWQRQPYNEPGTVYRVFDGQLATDTQKVYFGDSSNPTAVDVQELFANLDRGQSGIYIARYLDASGSFDAQMLHRMAMLSSAVQLPKLTQKAGTYYAAGNMTVTESPVPV
jgi:hypothetical protein